MQITMLPCALLLLAMGPVEASASPYCATPEQAAGCAVSLAVICPPLCGAELAPLPQTFEECARSHAGPNPEWGCENLPHQPPQLSFQDYTDCRGKLAGIGVAEGAGTEYCRKVFPDLTSAVGTEGRFNGPESPITGTQGKPFVLEIDPI